MATTTPNYGWAVPTSSDLVKNGATAIETLGDSIDASLVDLRGGTVGQSLVKASSTEMDFAWSSTPSASNPVLNSSMQIAQRGTSFALAAATNSYTLDRWQKYANGNATTISRQATGDTTNLPNIQFALRFQRNAGQTSLNLNAIGQSFETINSIPFAGKTVTLSFYARKGANYSATADALSVVFSSGTGTDQNLLIAGFTGDTSIVSSSATLTATWQRFTFTGSIASTATELGFYFGYNATGTAGAADYFEVTGVQIDVGSVALPFRTYAATIQGELAACQRYLPAIIANNNNIFGFATNTTTSYINCQFPVTARVAPTGITIPALSNFSLFNYLASSGTPTAIAFDNAGTSAGFISVTTTAASPTLVGGNADWLRVSNANGYILFTGCEL
jgi:hypothetical protein